MDKGWERVRADSNRKNGDDVGTGFISIDSEKFCFSRVLVKRARISQHGVATIYANRAARELGFCFHEDRGSPHDLKVSPKRGTGTSGFRCGATGIFRRHPWIRDLRARGSERYVPFSKPCPDGAGTMWCIQCRPAFENVVRRERSSDIPMSAQGVYRYKTADGDIVYIGKGNVLSQLRTRARDVWLFDIIEYSSIVGDDEQYRWEGYFIDEYQKRHDGMLPIYNKIRGHSCVGTGHPDTSV